MSIPINRVVKRTLTNEYRRQSLRRSGARRSAIPVISNGGGSVASAAQLFPALGIDAPSGTTLLAKNAGRPANALYVPEKASAAFVVTVGGMGGDGGGGGGGSYLPGNGIDIIGNVISTRHKFGGGLAHDSLGNYVLLPSNSGLETVAGGLKVKPGDGIKLSANGVDIDVSEIYNPNMGMGMDGNGDLYVRLDPHSGLNYGPGGGMVMGPPGALTWQSISQVVNDTHYHDVASSADVSTLMEPAASTLLHASNGRLGLRSLFLNGNLDFVGGDRAITASNSLYLRPQTDLILDPGMEGHDGLVILPDPQVMRTTSFNDFVAGIEGMLMGVDQGPYRSLALAKIKADELFVRKFIADEVRVQRGEWFLTRSYGIVETEFPIPGIGGMVDVWFEEAPGLGEFALFVGGNWIEFRTIDVSTGLIVQRIWFQAIAVGPNGYVIREAQTPDGTPNGHVSRQLWRLVRRVGGFDGMSVKKGEVGADFGVPTSSLPEGQLGQGIVHASALASATSGGPFIQVQVFSSLIEGVPHFENKTRMGNLKNTVDFTTDAWGIAAADDLSKPPSMGMSGFSIDAKRGARFFNTDLVIYGVSGVGELGLTRAGGLSLLRDINRFDNESQYVGWYQSINNLGQGVNLTGAIANYNPDGGINNTVLFSRGLGEEQANLQLVATRVDGILGAGIIIQTYGGVVDPLNPFDAPTLISLNAQSTRVQNGLGVTRGATFGVNGVEAPLHILQNDGTTEQRTGMLIEQKGSGDAVAHFYLTDNRYYSMGIDNDDGDKFKISLGPGLGGDFGNADIFIFNPATGQVTINGWNPGGSTPPSGLIGGDGIDLIGPTIQVDATVLRTMRMINSGPGLQGGGSLFADRTLSILLGIPSGLTLTGNVLAISDSIAGDGLDISGKVLRVDDTIPRATNAIVVGYGMTGGGVIGNDVYIAVREDLFALKAINIGTSGGIKGGDTLHASMNLSLDLLPLGGLSITGNQVGVNSSVVRSNKTIDAGWGLVGGGPLSGVVALSVNPTYFASQDTLIQAFGGIGGGGKLNTPNVPLYLKLAVGSGLYIDGSDLLNLDGSIFVKPNRAILTTFPLVGGGDLSDNRTLSLTLAPLGGLEVVPSIGLGIKDALAGNGLVMAAGKILNIGSGAGILVGAGAIAVNQAFAFVWEGLHTFKSGIRMESNLDFVGERNITTIDSGNLNIVPSGDLILYPGGGDVLPGGSSLIDLGEYNRKWRSLYASELIVESLVVSNVMATVGGRILVNNANVLIADMPSGLNQMDVKYNDPAFVPDAYLYMENVPDGVPQREALRIISGPTSIAGGYRFVVARGLNTTGAKNWLKGDGVVSQGRVVGDGFVDMASVSTIHGHDGPTVTIYARTSIDAWDDVAPVVTMGQLEGFVGYAFPVFGFATGNDLTLSPATGFKGLTADAIKGVSLYNTDLYFYNSGFPTMALDDIFGFRLARGSGGSNSISWVDNPITPVNSYAAIYDQAADLRDVLSIHSYSRVNGRKAEVFLQAWDTTEAKYMYLQMNRDKFDLRGTYNSASLPYLYVDGVNQRVGILTETPTEKLHVNRFQTANTKILVENQSPAAGGAAGLAAKTDGGAFEMGKYGTNTTLGSYPLIAGSGAYLYNSGQGAINIINAVATTGHIRFFAGNSTVLHAIIHGTTGRFGIWADNPQSILHVGNGSLAVPSNPNGFLGILVDGGDNSGINIRGATTRTYEAGMFIFNDGHTYLGNWSNAPLHIRTKNIDRINILGDGQVAINTTVLYTADSLIIGPAEASSNSTTRAYSPHALGLSSFQVNSNIAIGWIQTAGQSFPGNRFGAIPIANMFELATATASNMLVGTLHNAPLFFGTNNIGRMTILGNGNIGFGSQSNPTTLLHASPPVGVMGNFVMDVSTDSNAYGGFVAKIGASNYAQFLSWGYGRAESRFGQPLAGAVDLVSIGMARWLIGSLDAAPLYFGTNGAVRMVLGAGGQLLLYNGLSFGQTALSNYTEGTGLLAIYAASMNISAYSTRQITWQRIGNTCYFTIDFLSPTTTGANTNNPVTFALDANMPLPQGIGGAFSGLAKNISVNPTRTLMGDIRSGTKEFEMWLDGGSQVVALHIPQFNFYIHGMYQCA